jgi:glycosyltransferase involved in cell wall biosynthesis
MALLSVIIPVYNEAKTISQVLEKIDSLDIDKEIIVVDDGSNDGSDKVLRNIKFANFRLIHHSSNRGKGAAILTGLANASGEFVIIQDADLEYDPADYLKLIKEIKMENVDVVLGVRFTKGYHGLLIPRLGNQLLTGLLNILFGTRLNDCMTCYKLFRRETINKLNLRSQNFNIEIEIVSKVIKNGLRISEVPVSYHPRNYSEGKKIRIKDGIRAITSIITYRFID